MCVEVPKTLDFMSILTKYNNTEEFHTAIEEWIGTYSELRLSYMPKHSFANTYIRMGILDKYLVNNNN